MLLLCEVRTGSATGVIHTDAARAQSGSAQGLGAHRIVTRHGVVPCVVY